jgi:phage antirepressor YoqD-like protein
MNEEQNQIVKVDFHGGKIEATLHDGKIWVSVRRMCEHLGLQPHGQAEKLKTKEWATTQIICAVDPNGRKREHFMLLMDSLPMWLATIDTGRVAADVRSLLIAYQKEAADVLRDYFIRKRFNIPETMADALQLAADLAREIDRMRPHAELGESVSGAEGDVKIEIFAKSVIINGRHMGRNKMFEYLREKRVLMSGGDSHNLPYQRYRDLGWFTVHESTRPGTVQRVVTYTTRVTPRGQLGLVNMMKRDPRYRRMSVRFPGARPEPEQLALTLIN